MNFVALLAKCKVKFTLDISNLLSFQTNFHFPKWFSINKIQLRSIINGLLLWHSLALHSYSPAASPWVLHHLCFFFLKGWKKKNEQFLYMTKNHLRNRAKTFLFFFICYTKNTTACNIIFCSILSVCPFLSFGVRYTSGLLSSPSQNKVSTMMKGVNTPRTKGKCPLMGGHSLRFNWIVNKWGKLRCIVSYEKKTIYWNVTFKCTVMFRLQYCFYLGLYNCMWF